MRNGVNGIFQFQIYVSQIIGDGICDFIDNVWDI